jgi:hypothetical protein
MTADFGRPEIFCIHIGSIDEKGHASITLTINGESFGNPSISGELVHSIHNLKKLIGTLDNTPLPEETEIHPIDLGEWLIGPTNELGPMDPDGFQSRMKHIRFFGDQLDRYSMLSFCSGDSIIYSIWDNIQKKGGVFELPKSETIQAAKEYIDWYEGKFGFVQSNLKSFP